MENCKCKKSPGQRINRTVWYKSYDNSTNSTSKFCGTQRERVTEKSAFRIDITDVQCKRMVNNRLRSYSPLIVQYCPPTAMGRGSKVEGRRVPPRYFAGGDGVARHPYRSNLPLEILNRLRHPLAQRHLRFPFQNLLRLGDVRLALFGIILRQGFVDDFALRTGRADDFLGELQHRHFHRVADVHRQVVV